MAVPIQIKGIFNGSTIDPTAGQIAYNEGMHFNAISVETYETGPLMHKTQWQSLLINRVFFFVIQTNPMNEWGRTIDLSTQVHDLNLIIKASRNMESVIRTFAHSAQARERWHNDGTSEEYVKMHILAACDGLQKSIGCIEQVAARKFATIVLDFSLPGVLISIVNAYI